MTSDADYWLRAVQYLAWGALFGLFGGFVRVLRRGVRGWLDLLAQIAAAAFCGALAFGLLDGRVPELAMAACAGIAGNSGGMLLDALRWRMIRKVAGLDQGPRPPKELLADMKPEAETEAKPKPKRRGRKAKED